MLRPVLIDPFIGPVDCALGGFIERIEVAQNAGIVFVEECPRLVGQRGSFQYGMRGDFLAVRERRYIHATRFIEDEHGRRISIDYWLRLVRSSSITEKIPSKGRDKIELNGENSSIEPELIYQDEWCV